MDDWKKSGQVTAKARDYARSICKENILYIELANKIEAKIIELGARPAFPVDVSANEMAAHDSPFPDDLRVVKKGDVIKLDIGAHVNGCVTDTAVTIEVNTNKCTDLLKASEEALEAATKLAVEAGTRICDIGAAISEKIKKYGFTPISNLSGHGLGQYVVHDKPTIPNYNNNDLNKLVEGQHIAIEPFATTGIDQVKEGKPAGIYHLSRSGPVRMQSARQLVVHIEKEYNTLPFAARWLTKFPNYQFLLRLLEKEGIIEQYTQLPEVSQGIVSQAEHTVEVGYGVLTKA